MIKYDIISIGGATIDIFARPQKSDILRLNSSNGESKEMLCFNYGGKLQLEDIHELFGGGAANTSIGFNRLGLNTGICTLLGNDEWAKKVINNFKKENVSTEFIKTTNADKSSFSIIMNSFKGDRTVLFYPGANKKLRKKHLNDVGIMNTKWIFLNRVSSDDPSISDIITNSIYKNPKIRVAWNPGGDQIKNTYSKYRKLLKRVEILFLNKEEASQFSETTFEKQKTNIKSSNQLKSSKSNGRLPDYAFSLTNIFKKLSKTGVKIIVITDGKRGAQVFDGKNSYFCPVVNEDRVDTLGAGDAFCTGFAYAYLQKLSLQMCLKFGTINATSVVSFYGAQTGLLTKRQMQESFEKNKLQTTKINIK